MRMHKTLTMLAVMPIALVGSFGLLAAGAGAAPVPTAPGAPQGVLARATDIATARVTWLAPASNGGAKITQYDIVSNGPVGIVHTEPGTVRSDTFTGLPPGDYQFSVYAINAANLYGPLTNSNLVTVLAVTAPGAPEGVLARAPAIGTVRVTWLAPDSNGGAKITEYFIVSNGPVGIVHTEPGTARSDTFTGLPGGDYQFAVYAANASNLYGPLTSSNLVTVRAPTETLKVTAPVKVSFPDSSYTRNESAYTPFTVKNTGSTTETVGLGALGSFTDSHGNGVSGVWQYGLNLWSTSTLAPGQSATFGVDNVTNVDISAQAIGSGTYRSTLTIVDAGGGSDLMADGTVLATVTETVTIK